MSKLGWLPEIVTRLSVGFVFAQSGWGKLNNLEGVIGFFQELGIPFANLQAPFVAGVELAAGIALIVGLGVRLVSIPLIVIMIVAIATAKSAEIETWSDILGFSEYLYIILLIWLVTQGPSRFSLDFLIKKNFKKGI